MRVVRACRCIAFVGKDDRAAARVADRYTDPTKLASDLADGLFRCVPVGEVDLHSHRADAERFAFRHHRVRGQQLAFELIDIGGFKVSVYNCDIGTEASQPQGVSASQSACPARNKSHFAVQFPLGHGVSSLYNILVR